MRRLSTWLKVLFYVVAFILVILTVLANMGGNSQFHRESIEQFTAEATGYKTTITRLVNMTYFPSISVDFEDMELVDANNVPAAHIDKGQGSFSFWDVLLQNGTVKFINFQGIHVNSGVLLDKPMDFKSIGTRDHTDSQGSFSGQGSLGSTPLSFDLSMAAEGQGKSRKYWFLPDRELMLDLGEIKIMTLMQNGYNPYLSFKNLKISRSGSDIITGNVDISKRRTHEVTISGELLLPEFDTLLKLDIIADLNDKKFIGTIVSDNLNPKDFAAGSAFDDLVNRLVQILGDLQKDGQILDQFFAAQDITLNGKKLIFKDNTLALQ